MPGAVEPASRDDRALTRANELINTQNVRAASWSQVYRSSHLSLRTCLKPVVPSPPPAVRAVNKLATTGHARFLNHFCWFYQYSLVSLRAEYSR